MYDEGTGPSILFGHPDLALAMLSWENSTLW